MIVRPRLHWFRMLLVLHGSVLPKIAFQLMLIAAIAAGITLSGGELLGWKVGLTFVPFSLIGIALAIFLGFRNSASYERYWEARKLVGELLNASRSLTRQYLTWVDHPVDARDFVYGIIAFAHALRHQLRGSDPEPQLRVLLGAERTKRLVTARAKPAMLLLHLGEMLGQVGAQGRLHPQLAARMDQTLCDLTAVLGGCERIANTPIPYTYSVIVHRTVYLYCFLLPFGLVGSIGLMTPLIVTFVAYTFLALDALNEELEEPFGTLPNDLPLDHLTLGIEITLREMLGETDLPQPTAPRHYVLT